MHPIVTISCLLGFVFPLLILFFNKGYCAKICYLAFFLFFISFVVCGSFTFFYSRSLSRIAFATHFYAIFYLTGPFAFFYTRSILSESSKLSKVDYIHFALFVICFVGYIPYFFTSWDDKLVIAQNIMSTNLNISQFHLNKIFSHREGQTLKVVYCYFYAASLWYLVWRHNKSGSRPIRQNSHYKVNQKWMLIFCSIYSVFTIIVTIAMAYFWLEEDKSVFLERASGFLLFSSFAYVLMNMIIMFSPRILYGLPIDYMVKPFVVQRILMPSGDELFSKDFVLSHLDSKDSFVRTKLQLFTADYITTIETALNNCQHEVLFVNTDFKLALLSNQCGIPQHHLTYYFNEITKVTFCEWRNGLRIAYAKELINQGVANRITLQALSLQCGFASQSTFIRAFRIITGESPSTYIKCRK